MVGTMFISIQSLEISGATFAEAFGNAIRLLVINNLGVAAWERLSLQNFNEWVRIL